MSMVEQFFSVNYADRGDLFEGLSIWEHEEYRQLQGTYPVIFLSFASIKEACLDATVYQMCHLLQKQFEKFSFLQKSDKLSDAEKAYCKRMTEEVSRIDASMALHQLSDFNNPKVVTTTCDEYAACFGFTEEEVFNALDEFGLSNEKEQVKAWYDGFTFGEYKDIYNPWSILNFIDTNGKYKTYWANTSGNRLIGKLIREGNSEIKEQLSLSLRYMMQRTRKIYRIQL